MSKAAELAKMGEVLTNSQVGGRRNIVINGAMNISQRSTSVTGISGDGYQTVDRFNVSMGNTDGRLTMAQVADAHDGFANAMKLTCTTADTSIASNERLIIKTSFEGQDLQQIKKGTSDAEQLTLSFYVKGNASATYTCEIADDDNTRYVAQEFPVTTDWVRIVKTFVADTTGAFDNDNAKSMSVNFWLHAGSDFTGGTFSSNTVHTTGNQRVGDNQTSFFDSTDRTFFLTGVQLEVGSQATPFEHRSFGEELQLCQRYYYERCGSGTALGVDPYHWVMNGIAYNTTLGVGGFGFPVNMRATPTLGVSAVGHFQKNSAGRGDAVTAINLYDGTENATTATAYIQFDSSNSTAGGAFMQTVNASARLNFDAEL